MRKSYLLLCTLALWLVNCNSASRLAASQNLARVGSKSAAAMAAYYESLADMVSRQPALEVFFQSINPRLFKPVELDTGLLDHQRMALLHRAQLARDLQGFYDALQKLAVYKTGDNVGKAVDNLTSSLALITSEPPRLFGQNASVALKPVISSIATWKQSRDSRRAIIAIQTTLIGLQQLVDSEKIVYGIMLSRYFTLLNGNNPGGGGPQGVAHYLLATHSMSIEFMLQQVPELQSLPWNTGPVQDPTIKKAMQQVLTDHLSALEIKAKAAAQNVVSSLQELTIEHQKLLDGRPLTLATVLSYQQQVQDYIDLWHKYSPKK